MHICVRMYRLKYMYILYTCIYEYEHIYAIYTYIYNVHVMIYIINTIIFLNNQLVIPIAF